MSGGPIRLITDDAPAGVLWGDLVAWAAWGVIIAGLAGAACLALAAVHWRRKRADPRGEAFVALARAMGMNERDRGVMLDLALGDPSRAAAALVCRSVLSEAVNRRLDLDPSRAKEIAWVIRRLDSAPGRD